MEHGLPKITLSDRERELIALLAQGHTDVSAAEQLNISARSVTNILRSLMDRLGVDNRFQLGLALGFLRKAHVPAAISSAPATGPASGTKEQS
jgi:DNA-binding CsgD family transcriptional regulator